MNKRNKIVVVGSSNTDMVVRVGHFPKPGETMLGSGFMTAQGGKGANQAVAAARLGGDTIFVARLGDDVFGKRSLQLLKAEGMDTRYVKTTPGVASGVALITVDDKAENEIIVASGANAHLSVDDVKAAEADIKQAAILLMQLETPLPALIYAAKVAHEAGVLVILNPAPFPPEPLPEELLRHVDIIIPNETEAQGMTGIEVTDDASVLAAIRAIQARGVGQVIITVGKRGAATMLDGQLATIPTFPTKAVDTTAAGDTFCGALCVALSKGYKLQEAIRRANKAASISVTRMGAQPSVPTADEVFGQDL
ncbi:MAG: ribokinase [Prevotellaceae bacterium]|nr:ribokinase [Prevotellaceae bacterium]MDY3856803.1 ribokinase [Bacteroidaceae bacterium]